MSLEGEKWHFLAAFKIALVNMKDIQPFLHYYQVNNLAAVSSSQDAQPEVSSGRVLKKSGKLLA